MSRNFPKKGVDLTREVKISHPEANPEMEGKIRHIPIMKIFVTSVNGFVAWLDNIIEPCPFLKQVLVETSIFMR